MKGEQDATNFSLRKKRRRLRVLFICQSLEVGGVEDLLLLLARRLTRQKYEVGVLTLVTEGALADELRGVGVQVACLGAVPGWRHIFALFRLVRWIRKWHPDVIHTAHVTANTYGRLAGVLARVPAIFSTEVNVLPSRPRRHRIIERFLAPFTWRVITNSAEVAQAYRKWTGISGERVTVLEAPPDFERFQPREGQEALRRNLGLSLDHDVLGVVASLTEKKGHWVFLDALRQLERSRVHVLLVGDGPLRPALTRAVEEAGLARVVSFLGVRRDLDVIFGAIDILVLPSLWEGVPLVLLAGMAAGLPVVATAVGGVPEVVRDGVNGLLVPAGDASALARALGQLVKDRRLRAMLGVAARETVTHRYDPERFVCAVAALYSEGVRRKLG